MIFKEKISTIKIIREFFKKLRMLISLRMCLRKKELRENKRDEKSEVRMAGKSEYQL